MSRIGKSIEMEIRIVNWGSVEGEERMMSDC